MFFKAPVTTPQGGRVQERQRDGAGRVLGLLRMCARVSLSSVRGVAHPAWTVVIRGERGGPVRGIEHRQTDEVTQVPETGQPARVREDRSLRVRVRPSERPEEGDVLHQRQHHEADRRSVPQGVRRDCRGVSGTGERALDCRYRHGAAGGHARDFRCGRDAESLRRYPFRRGRARWRGRWAWPGRRTSANMAAMFEAIHGSAPRRAGQRSGEPVRIAATAA